MHTRKCLFPYRKKALLVEWKLKNTENEIHNLPSVLLRNVDVTKKRALS